MTEKQPKGITYLEEFEPDMDKMSKALRIVFEYLPDEEQEQTVNMREVKEKANKAS